MSLRGHGAVVADAVDGSDNDEGGVDDGIADNDNAHNDSTDGIRTDDMPVKNVSSS